MPGDPLWTEVSFISGFDGVDGSTAFTDDSLFEHPLSGSSGVALSTDQFRFGTSSLLIDNNPFQRVSAPSDPSFDLADSDFTIEAWVWQDSTFSGFLETICGVWEDVSDRGWLLVIDRFNDEIAFLYSTNGSDSNRLDVAHGVTFVQDQWNHVAVTRFGSTLLFHVNGVFLGSHTLTATIHLPPGIPFTVGSYEPSAADLKGFIDELRVTNGAPRYPSLESFDALGDPFERGPVTSPELVLQDVTTLVCFLKMEAPGGDVKICDGGQIQFSSELYESHHGVFGAIHTPNEFDAAFGDISEAASVTFAPSADADIADWWRDDLFDVRIRVWLGELDADNFNVSNATLLGDYLIDTYSRMQGAGGENLLEIELIGRAEKLFLTNEGNVCSQRFHQSVWSGEKGFNNATDVIGYLAWGAATPPRGSGTSSGTSSTFTQFNIGTRQ